MITGIHSYGIDYLRVTAVHVEILRPAYEALSKGDRFRSQGRWRDYEGVWEEKDLFFGARHDGGLLQVSGALASTSPLPLLQKAKPTRTDLQVTLVVSEEPSHFIDGIYEQVRCSINDGRASRQRKVVHIHGVNTSSTLYFGSRESERMIRIYDKERESGDENYKQCIRFEVEYKGNLARNALRLLQERQGDVGGIILGEYELWKERYDVQVHEGLPLFGCSPVGGTAKETSDVKKLKWLSRQVRPVIEHLKGKGFDEATLAGILGLEMNW